MRLFGRLNLGGLARSTLSVLAWNIARLGTQMAWMLLLARLLGVDGYGVFSGAAGLAMVLSGFVGAGLGLRLYQDVARASDVLGMRWAQALQALRWSGGIVSALFVAAGLLWLPDVSWRVIFCIAISELICMPVVTFVAFAYAGLGRMGQAAAAPVAMSVARLGAVVIASLFASRPVDIAHYAYLHAGMAAVAAIWLLARCRNQLAPPSSAASIDWADLKEGVRLSSIWASGLALGSVDKPVALRFYGAEATGNYSAAQRFVSLMAAPVDALITAVMPRLFRAGAGQASHPRLMQLLALCAFAYGSVAGIFLWLGADWLPLIIGAEFAGAVPVLQIMAFYIPAYCLRTLGANRLLGNGFTQWRFASEMSALVILVGLMSLGARDASATNAALALVATEILLALMTWYKILSKKTNGGRIES